MHILFLVFFLFTLSFGNEHLAKGDEYYSKRANGSYGNMAKPTNTEEAIKNYTLALTDKASKEEAAWKLLRAYYFLGSFTMGTEKAKERRVHFEKAKNEGKAFLNEFSNNTEIAYWYSVNLALWIRELNSVKVIFAGGMSETRNVAKILIDSGKNGNKIAAARGYQLLGGLHKKVPKIPGAGIHKDSIEFYLNKSMQLDPNNLDTRLIMAEYYKEDLKDMEKAKAVLQPVLGNKPRANMFLEDERNYIKMKRLLEE
ncbi:MAG: hypothetical protein FWH22_11865 [Fibromonadales bacterium]|nr:hypothetical protein [Fibromonadales bacterium]